jgi:hypothetical protein
VLLRQQLWPFERSNLQWHLSEIVAKAFAIFDVNSDGTIGADELRHVMRVLGEPMEDDELASFMVEALLHGGNAVEEDAGRQKKLAADMPTEFDLSPDSKNPPVLTYDVFACHLLRPTCLNCCTSFEWSDTTALYPYAPLYGKSSGTN